MDKKPIATVDEYLAGIASDEVRRKLDRFRQIIKEEAPEAEERIGYGMPGYYLNGPLIYYAAFKNHYSLFAGGGTSALAEELSEFKTSKGTIQIPNDKTFPEDFLRKMVRRRVEENLARKGR